MEDNHSCLLLEIHDYKRNGCTLHTGISQIALNKTSLPASSSCIFLSNSFNEIVGKYLKLERLYLDMSGSDITECRHYWKNFIWQLPRSPRDCLVNKNIRDNKKLTLLFHNVSTQGFLLGRTTRLHVSILLKMFVWEKAKKKQKTNPFLLVTRRQQPSEYLNRCPKPWSWDLRLQDIDSGTSPARIF